MQIAVAHHVQTIVGIAAVEIALAVHKYGMSVNPRETFLLGHSRKLAVDVNNHRVLAGHRLITAKGVVNRQKRLDIKPRLRGSRADVVDKIAEGGGNRVGGEVVGDIVGAAKQEYLAGMPVDHTIDAVADALDYIAYYTAVLDFGIAEQLMPFTNLRQAVAYKHDVVLIDRKLVKQTRPLIVQLVIFIWFVGKSHHCHDKR